MSRKQSLRQLATGCCPPELKITTTKKEHAVASFSSLRLEPSFVNHLTPCCRQDGSNVAGTAMVVDTSL